MGVQSSSFLCVEKEIRRKSSFSCCDSAPDVWFYTPTNSGDVFGSPVGLIG